MGHSDGTLTAAGWTGMVSRMAVTTKVHLVMPVESKRVWTGRYSEWLHEVRCRCGWSAVADSERLAELAAADHLRG